MGNHRVIDVDISKLGFQNNKQEWRKFLRGIVEGSIKREDLVRILDENELQRVKMEHSDINSTLGQGGKIKWKLTALYMKKNKGRAVVMPTFEEFAAGSQSSLNDLEFFLNDTRGKINDDSREIAAQYDSVADSRFDGNSTFGDDSNHVHEQPVILNETVQSELSSVPWSGEYGGSELANGRSQLQHSMENELTPLSEASSNEEVVNALNVRDLSKRFEPTEEVPKSLHRPLRRWRNSVRQAPQLSLEDLAKDIPTTQRMTLHDDGYYYDREEFSFMDAKPITHSTPRHSQPQRRSRSSRSKAPANQRLSALRHRSSRGDNGSPVERESLRYVPRTSQIPDFSSNRHSSPQSLGSFLTDDLDYSQRQSKTGRHSEPLRRRTTTSKRRRSSFGHRSSIPRRRSTSSRVPDPSSGRREKYSSETEEPSQNLTASFMESLNTFPSALKWQINELINLYSNP